MPVSPTGITSPAGWHDIVTNGGPSNGFAIQWTALAPADDLGAGDSLAGFSFESSLTLAQLESPASGNPSDPVQRPLFTVARRFPTPDFNSPSSPQWRTHLSRPL
jgi:hypothetical protein